MKIEKKIQVQTCILAYLHVFRLISIDSLIRYIQIYLIVTCIMYVTYLYSHFIVSTYFSVVTFDFWVLVFYMYMFKNYIVVSVIEVIV